MTILKIDNLSKTYEHFELKNLELSLGYGKVLGLIGENGSGKTTTINSILNLIDFQGHIEIFGKNNREDLGLIKEDIGVVFDDTYFYEKLKLKYIERIMASAYKNWNSKKFKELMEAFKLKEDSELGSLSMGMKTKFSLALALSHEPRLLILDEPTSGLDPASRDDVLNLLYDFIQDGSRSILFSTHLTGDLEKIADDIVFLNKGQIILNREKDRILEEFALVKTSKDNLLKIDKSDILVYRELDYSCELLAENKFEFMEKYSHLDDLVVERPSLDQLMVLYIKGVII